MPHNRLFEAFTCANDGRHAGRISAVGVRVGIEERQGQMSDRDYTEELRSEQHYVAMLHERLDAERAEAAARFRAALAGEGESLVDRDARVRALAREVKRLSITDSGLCFGRLDAQSGEHAYIGRIGILDDGPDAGGDFESLLIDWRAPLARPFYTATAIATQGMHRRRQFHSRGRELVEFTDEVFGRPGADERGDAALLAAVNAPRGTGMRDIVSTIQVEQDEIIRLDAPGIVVIEGGPGTGKTAVALHRVAYLLYTHRQRIERHGVLVVGPNPAFLTYIGRVLPSLGESEVVFATVGDLLPGLHATAEDAPEPARIKGSLSILDVLAAAIADRQRLPEEPIPIDLAEVALTIGADTAQWAREEARDSGKPHNEARAIFVDVVSYVLVERAVGRLVRNSPLPVDDRDKEQLRVDARAELAQHDGFAAAIAQLWPRLEPARLLAQLLGSHERLTAAGASEALWRADGSAWTVSDVPLLDELAELLGRDDSAVRAAAAAEGRRQAAYAEEVLDMLVGRADSMDDEDHLYATDLLYAEDLAERFSEQDNRDLAERAAADREWTYRHVVVDEAQELSEMDWRVLMRRCPAHSFTIVGDLAQRRSPAGARSWAAMIDRYAPGRWKHRALTVNYRTPAEIMELASGLLAEFAPEIEAPVSVRSSGVEPVIRRVDADGIAGAIAEFEAEEADRPGTSVVIGPADVPGAVTPAQTKGLEYDAVLVIEPDRILAEGPAGAAELYVALTRATQRLTVVHVGDLPAALTVRTSVV